MEPSRLTRGLRHGLGADTSHFAVVPPLVSSTNYMFTPDGKPRGNFDYTRTNNPTRDLFGEALAILEGGAGCTVTSSGLSAITLVLMSMVRPGGRVVAPHDCYGGTWRLLTTLASQGRFTLELADLTSLDAATQVLSQPCDLVLIESPSNPLLRITDIAAVAALAHAQGARVAVDNTFCSPLLQQPLDLGADLVVHSTTKFINGHSDSCGGAVIAASQTDDETLHTWANTLGVTAGAYDAWLSLRGLRTLAARLRCHADNTTAVLGVLSAHPGVERVHHPGLPHHPGHDLAARQQSGFGSVLSFELAGGHPAAVALLERLTCFTIAESLGGVESLICHPGTMTHAAMPESVQRAAGITPGLVRVSVGIEAAEDLVSDLSGALNAG